MTSSYVGCLLEGDALDTALHEITLQAQHAVAGVDSAGAVLERAPGRTRAASGPLAAEIDGVQYRAGQGPCLHAFRTNRVVLLDVGGQDRRWPTFQAAAVAAGAHTVLSLPLRLDDLPIGSLNLYSRSWGAFTPAVIHEAELYACPAALRLSQAGVAVHAVEVAEAAVRELQDRATIDCALGVLMGLHEDPSVERAVVRLQQTASELGLDVRSAAARIVAAPPVRGERRCDS
ncbi:MAG: GAF and ANTAR domain-containing protein [Janthinobacterium lividum]